jgi:LuxR family maltose regulon positive regulatory protein
MLDETLDAVEVNLRKEPLPENARFIEGQATVLRSATAYLVHRDYSLTFSLATQALELLSGIESGTQGIAALFRALAQQALGERVDAVHSLEVFIRSPIQLGPSKIQTFIGLTILHQMAGDLQALSRTLNQFLNLASHLKHANAVSGFNRAAGWLSYEWNDLIKAAEYSANTIKYRYKTNFISYYFAMILLAKIDLVQGQLAEGQSRLEDLRAETLRLNHRLLLVPLEALEASTCILSGDIYSALRWARSFDDHPLYDSVILLEATSLTHARILILHGTDPELQRAKDRLYAKLTAARSEHFTQREISILVHLALAHERLGERAQALELTEQAVQLAQPGGFIRTFVDIGQPMRELLKVLCSSTPKQSQSYLAKLLASFDTEAYPTPANLDPKQQAAPTITRRELEVLRLTQAERTDAEIASELVIALSTARKHAGNLYHKLDANNRWQAVQKAEELGIL